MTKPSPSSISHIPSFKLQQLQKQGIISPVQFSSWAAPIVPVLKRNGLQGRQKTIQSVAANGRAGIRGAGCVHVGGGCGKGCPSRAKQRRR